MESWQPPSLFCTHTVRRGCTLKKLKKNLREKRKNRTSMILKIFKEICKFLPIKFYIVMDNFKKFFGGYFSKYLKI